MTAKGIHCRAFREKGTVPVVSPIPPFATTGTVPSVHHDSRKRRAFSSPNLGVEKILSEPESLGRVETRAPNSRCCRQHISHSKKPGCNAPRLGSGPGIFALDYDARRNGFINPFVSGCAVEVAAFCARADSSFVCSERVLYALRAQAFQTSTSSDGV
jgi:hypothetical protein